MVSFRICIGWCFTSSSTSLGCRCSLPNGEQTVYCWGSLCFLSVSALAGMLCPPRWSCLYSCLRSCLPAYLSSGLGCCLSLVSGLFSQLVSHLVWDAVFASLVLSFSCLWSCLPACLISGLGCGVRLAGLVFLLSPVLSPSLSHKSHIWSRMLCPPRWSCLSLVSGLVSQLVSYLV